MSIKHYKVIILGSGPAGCTAAIYASRSGLDPLMIKGLEPGGQLTITTDVENYPGFEQIIQGPWLMDQMEKQAISVGTKIFTGTVVECNLTSRPLMFKTDNGEVITSDSLIIATGATAKWLNIPSEDKYKGFGVSACATCDGFFFKNKIVAVIGGGNTAVEEALFLTKFASKVILIHRRDILRAEKILQERLFNNKNIEIIWNHTLEEIIGEKNKKIVKSILIKSTQENKKREIELEGVFIAIGHKPNTNLFAGKLKMDKEGYIITKSDSTETNVEGIFAAGDVQDKVYRQAVTAAGQGCMAAIEAEKFISNTVLKN
jgi:thioredoxin reductase (NADPH)